MRNFIENLKFRLQMWMQGRCGIDELSKVMLIISVIFFILSNVLRLFYYAAALLMICACFSLRSRAASPFNSRITGFFVADISTSLICQSVRSNCSACNKLSRIRQQCIRPQLPAWQAPTFRQRRFSGRQAGTCSNPAEAV